MTIHTGINTACLATITVTYNPEVEVLKRQLKALPAHSTKIVVDNASRPEIQQQLKKELLQFSSLHLIVNDVNLGLGAAINSGAKIASTLPAPATYVLLLDQDSEPLTGSVEILLDTFEQLRLQGHSVGCVGPSLVDPITLLSHGFHQMTRLCWKRCYPSTEASAPVNCANLNGSGTLLPLELFQRLGGLDETLFIDHIDTEWSFRVAANGYSLWGIPKAVFKHCMGQSSTRFWLFGWRVWPVRAPLRHYFLFRNAAMLMKRSYIPAVWKIWAIAKLALTASIMALTGPQRRQQISRMWQGLYQGLKINAD
ncbi:glycosyltransferase family 2 protein [Pseudomonas saudiphocaensis]|uniref:glycosyltransferase family 2 protein n=1 Tax=Pseudomonas saudiphocaensis TaxID=1499686 RepID=UPI00187D4C46|nr:glycosyltransferase family 2 protein [Pseudomonas saudiphocaensis]MBE7927347.1 glycosyltransferase family 2 protein [Pseudomonas saudiphocaensis]